MEGDSSASNGSQVFTNGGAGGTSGATNGKAAQVLQRRFGEVQGILEHNRVLIQQIGQNHEAREADGLTRNVALIRELNANIARVVDLYNDLSSTFTRSVAAPSNLPSAADADATNGYKRPHASQ